MERKQYANNYDSSDAFDAMVDILRTNDECKNTLQSISQSSSIDALYLIKYLPDARKSKKSVYTPLNTKLQNSSECVSMFSRFISTTLDVKRDTLRQAIENKTYIPNECWIKSFTVIVLYLPLKR